MMIFARHNNKFLVWVLLSVMLLLGCVSAQAAADPIEFTIEAAPTELTEPGDVTVSLRVSNTGDKDMLDPVTLLDPAGNVVSSFGDNGSIVLGAGKYLSWSGTYAVTEEDLDAGRIVYTIKYNLEDEDGNIAACTQQGAIALTYTGQRVRLQADRTLSPEVVRQGKNATAIYELTNKGNVTLTSIKVTESLTGRTQTVDKLEPGDSETVTFSTRMGNQDLKSGAQITYKAEGSDETLTAAVEEVVVPLAKPNLSAKLEAVGDVNIGENATLRITFINEGNVSYTDITVKDEKKGEMLTGLEVPAGATVSFDKEIALNEPTDFKFVCSLNDNTGEAKEISTNKVTVSVFDPEKSLRLNLNLTCDHDAITQAPATVRFTLNVTNNSNVKAEDVVIRHGDVTMYNVKALEAGEAIQLQWDVSVSQAGQFRFTAYAEDELGNNVSFESNTHQLTYVMPTDAPTVAPVVTVQPLVTVAPPTEADLNPALGGIRNGLFTAALVVGLLFGACVILVAASTVVRAGNKRKSENAYDHLELVGSRDYTEEKLPSVEGTVQTEEVVVHGEEESAPYIPEESDPLPHEKVLSQMEDDPDAPAPEVTEQDVIEHKLSERNAAADEEESGFRVSRERNEEAPAQQPRRRRAARTHERTEDGEE
ncbi:MAG: hypothetical protein E7326_01100 [Clostridiales bacterium]|nr:hypothetical protein [Clostridiales bacterium]